MNYHDFLQKSIGFSVILRIIKMNVIFCVFMEANIYKN